MTRRMPSSDSSPLCALQSLTAVVCQRCRLQALGPAASWAIVYTSAQLLLNCCSMVTMQEGWSGVRACPG